MGSFENNELDQFSIWWNYKKKGEMFSSIFLVFKEASWEPQNLNLKRKR